MGLVACRPSTPNEQTEPTWHQDVAPLVAGHCHACHAAGGVGPFSLETYEDAEPWAESILEAVESGFMPPWGARATEQCQPPAPFLHDLSLTPEEVELLHAWVDAGSPEGDPDSAAPLPELPSQDLEDPDAVIEVGSDFVVGGDADLWVCFSLDPQLDEDVWLDGLQVVPGNPRVFHHGFVTVDPNSESADLANEDGWYPCFGTPQIDFGWIAGAYLPGTPPTEPPPGVGMAVPAGSRLILTVHYHPTGAGTEYDRSSVALRWQDQPTDYLGAIVLAGNYYEQAPDGTGLQPGPNDPPEGPAFVIPAGARDHTEQMVAPLGSAYPTARVWSVATHMHYAGAGMRIELDRPGSETSCLLETPDWDPDWQRLYQYDTAFDDLPEFRADDELLLSCVYDNSTANTRLMEALEAAGIDAPMEISLGDAALNEMCLGMFGLAWPTP